IGEVVTGGVAETAGFLNGDKIISADGVEIDDWQLWVKYVQQRPGKNITVVIERDSNERLLSIVPEAVEEAGKVIGRVGLGVEAYTIPESMIRSYEYSVPGAFIAGVNKTWETSGFVLLSIKKLILGEISTKNLSGPITIAKVAGSSAESGLRSFIGFVALLSVFLAVFNLLPIPILDGGHLFYYFIEVIKGRPVSDKVQMLGYQVGLFLVIGLSVLALYNDIMRL